jgi:TRAP transporter 4TM/12TM fusion protein
MSFFARITTTGQQRTLATWVKHPIRGLAFLTAIWSIYQAVFTDIDVMAMTIIFLSLSLCLAFLLVTPHAEAPTDRISWFDYLLAAISIGAGLHFGLKLEEIATRIALFDALTPFDIFWSSALLLMLLEATRRIVGFRIVLLTLLFFAYNLYGNIMPNLIRHNGIDYLHFIDIAFFTTDGVFGVPLRVAATYAFMFVIFGTLLTRCGAGEFFYRLAAAVTGKRPGGPAKVAVVSSGLFGMVSGNPVADVVTTGSVTIPIMVRSGIPAKIAAAIEATASTGGSIMPPVMGAAAFIMAEYIGVSYATIAYAAVTPAFLYYVSLYAQVHFYSRRNDLQGLASGEIPSFWTTLKSDATFLIPLVVLLALLERGYSPSFVGFVSSLSVIAAALLRRSTRMGLITIYEQLADATERMLPVAIICGTAGLILAGMTMTGLANKFSEVIAFLSGGNLFIALACAAVLTTLLGMGLPTSGTYILASTLIGAIIVKHGVGVMQAHMFLLYFAAMSAITPPVAISSYAAAAIARTNPLATSLYALRKAVVALVVPFGFVLHEELLLMGGLTGIVHYVTAATVGAILLAAAFERFFVRPLHNWESVLCGIAGLLLLVGGLEAHLVGLVMIVAGLGRIGVECVRQRFGNVVSRNRGTDSAPPAGRLEVRPE